MLGVLGFNRAHAGCWAMLAVLLALTGGSRASAQQRAFIRDPNKTFRTYVWSYKELQQRQVVMQKLDYSCGAAAIATIVRYYWGDDVGEETFLQLLPKLKLTQAQMKDRIENGLTLTDLRDITELAGYDAAMGKIQFEGLAESRVPVIVGITVRKHDHFAVFRGSDGYYAYLADSIRGNIRTPIPEFLKQWQKNAVLVVAKRDTEAKDVNPMAVRWQEIDRGLTNEQWVHRQLMTTVPNPVRVGP